MCEVLKLEGLVGRCCWPPVCDSEEALEDLGGVLLPLRE